MGQYLSKFNNKSIDGLGVPAIDGPRPTESSHTKLEQLLRSLVNYEPGSAAPILVSLYYFGYTSTQLTQAFDNIGESLVEWPEEDPIADSIGETTMKDYFGKLEYQQRYFEFFRDQLTEFTDWYEILRIYLPDLGLRLLGSDCAPINQLAVAVEIDDPVLAMHALAYAASTNSVPEITGFVELSPQQLLDGCTGDALVAAQSICELKLSNKSFSSHIDPILGAFAHHIGVVGSTPSPKHTTAPTWERVSPQLANDPLVAPKLRAEVFAFQISRSQDIST